MPYRYHPNELHRLERQYHSLLLLQDPHPPLSTLLMPFLPERVLVREIDPRILIQISETLHGTARVGLINPARMRSEDDPEMEVSVVLQADEQELSPDPSSYSMDVEIS